MKKSKTFQKITPSLSLSLSLYLSLPPILFLSLSFTSLSPLLFLSPLLLSLSSHLNVVQQSHRGGEEVYLGGHVRPVASRYRGAGPGRRMEQRVRKGEREGEREREREGDREREREGVSKPALLC
jgi:hypothetical protein